LVIGVYVGMDEPQSLGRYETGAKTALPIFKDFVKKAIKKKDARPFKVPPNIKMMVIDLRTGKKASFASKETIIESYKQNSSNLQNNQFNKINNRLSIGNNILRFY
jgi:penicillin-binding protein 1A